MPGDATPPPLPPQPPQPPPELPPGLLAEYLESARAQLSVLAGLAERLVAAGGDREALDALRRETPKGHGPAGPAGAMAARAPPARPGRRGEGLGPPPRRPARET